MTKTNLFRLVLLFIGVLLYQLTIYYFTGFKHQLGLHYLGLASENLKDGTFSNSLFVESCNSLFIKPWLFILTALMRIFNSPELGSIVSNSIFSFFNILLIINLLKVFITKWKYIILFIILIVFSPQYICASGNPLYENFFLTILLLSVYYYSLYFRFGNYLHLFYNGIAISLMALIHNSVNIFIPLLVLIPVFFGEKLKGIRLLTYLGLIGILPLIQVLIWKYICGVYLPKMEIVETDFYNGSRTFVFLIGILNLIPFLVWDKRNTLILVFINVVFYVPFLFKPHLLLPMNNTIYWLISLTFTSMITLKRLNLIK